MTIRGGDIGTCTRSSSSTGTNTRVLGVSGGSWVDRAVVAAAANL
jgi:hypothetical protein